MSEYAMPWALDGKLVNLTPADLLQLFGQPYPVEILRAIAAFSACEWRQVLPPEVPFE